MTQLEENKVPRILVIDRSDESWLGRTVESLSDSGYDAHAINLYSIRNALNYSPVDLVLLGCAYFGDPERKLVQMLLKENLFVVVYCADTTMEEKEEIFALGKRVRAVKRKTYSRSLITQEVAKMLKTQVDLQRTPFVLI